QIPIELCRRIAQVHVVGIDLAEHMLRVGRENVRRAGLEGRIDLVLCDAKGIPSGDGEYGGVISNSIVHHIPEPRRGLAELWRGVAPGGLLFVRDLLRPPDAGTLAALVDQYAAGANEHQRTMFAESLHAALTLDEMRALVAGLHFDPETVRQTSDRHWTW